MVLKNDIEKQNKNVLVKKLFSLSFLAGNRFLGSLFGRDVNVTWPLGPAGFLQDGRVLHKPRHGVVGEGRWVGVGGKHFPLGVHLEVGERGDTFGVAEFLLLDTVHGGIRVVLSLSDFSRLKKKNNTGSQLMINLSLSFTSISTKGGLAIWATGKIPDGDGTQVGRWG